MAATATMPATFAHWLAQQMTVRGLNQPEVARRLGVKQQAVSSWLRQDDPVLPDATRAQAFADLFDVDVLDVLAVLQAARTSRSRRPSTVEKIAELDARVTALEQILDTLLNTDHK